MHVQVGLYAFFHRLYGMYPCNFLSYLRQQYAESNKDNQLVFVHTIRPMLNTVRMHPLLVTHSRELEKTPARWRKLELHDVLVESSRYALITQESTREDVEPPVLDVGGGGALHAEATPGTDRNRTQFYSTQFIHFLYHFYPCFRPMFFRHS